jgi:nitrite reductase/ring-hydroxylating ferredoxin subunit
MKTNGGHPAPGNKAFDGYHQTWIGQSDQELTRVGPGTAMGEYLRRYWQPVAMASELGSAPKLIRILGEDLVLFRETGGRLGLVQRRCPHRRASLEFGLPEARGIRCCYHGWLFDVDGTPLEVPGQPEGVEARICKTVRLGAYPRHLGAGGARLRPLQGALPLQLAASARRHRRSDPHGLSPLQHQPRAVLPGLRRAWRV